MAHFPIREVSRWNWPNENERWGRSISSTTLGTTLPIFNDIIHHWISSPLQYHETRIHLFILHEIFVWKHFNFSYRPFHSSLLTRIICALMAEIMLSINLTALRLCQMLLKNPHLTLRLGTHSIGKRIIHPLEQQCCPSLYAFFCHSLSLIIRIPQYLQNWSHGSKSISLHSHLFTSQYGHGGARKSVGECQRYHRPREQDVWCTSVQRDDSCAVSERALSLSFLPLATIW